VVRQRPRANTQDRKTLMAAWHDIPWKNVQRHVFRLHKRMYRATPRGEVRTVRTRQNLLSKSWSARL
jgi:RNA-directed DNA polymerase